MKLPIALVRPIYRIHLVVLFYLLGNVAGSQLHALPPSEDSHQVLPPVEELPSSRRMSFNDFRSYAENRSGLILDARPQTAYQAGHVPGALSLSAADFESGYAALKAKLETNKNQRIVVYCAGLFCKSSQMVQKQLVAKGYTQVFVFPKGWTGWTLAGLPQEHSP
jgi:rhodanese-related sulfurtransferase